MKALNIGVIGLGNIGQKHCDALRQIRQANVVAVSDINTEVLAKTAASYNATPYADLKELLQHPGLEAVLVALPDQLHRDAVILAAQAGKHILVEKPIATTEADAQDMIRAAAQAGVKLMVGFTFKVRPALHSGEECRRVGKVGRPRQCIRSPFERYLSSRAHRWAHGRAAFLGYPRLRYDALGCRQ